MKIWKCSIKGMKDDVTYLVEYEGRLYPFSDMPTLFSLKDIKKGPESTMFEESKSGMAVFENYKLIREIK